jgi:solute carrier family 25 S-adenosylmethionine transporter 26
MNSKIIRVVFLLFSLLLHLASSLSKIPGNNQIKNKNEKLMQQDCLDEEFRRRHEITHMGTMRNIFSGFGQVLHESRRHLAAAAAARAVSIFVMYPVDTIKTRMQLRQPVQWNNPVLLFRGVQGSLVGQVPYGVLTFGSYEMYKKYLLQKYPNAGKYNVFLFAIAAVLGDITGSGWLCPSEVLKQQMQGGMYTSTMDAIQGIWKKGGGISGFYQGYFGGLARDVPFRVAQLTSYEITKNVYLRSKSAKVSSTSDAVLTSSAPLMLSPIESAVCGAVAGTFSAAVTAPLDRIKTILMTEGGGTVLSCARKIVAEEGARGLFAGIVPRVTYIAPSVVIFFTVYEQVQQRFLLHQE